MTDSPSTTSSGFPIGSFRIVQEHRIAAPRFDNLRTFAEAAAG
ncbi:MAG: hypothetical protein WBA46_07210 [Thermomicrobiales bacterium]